MKYARLKSGLSDCEEPVRRKILWENAQNLYEVEGPTAKDEAQRDCNGWGVKISR